MSDRRIRFNDWRVQLATLAARKIESPIEIQPQLHIERDMYDQWREFVENTKTEDNEQSGDFTFTFEL